MTSAAIGGLNGELIFTARQMAWRASCATCDWSMPVEPC